MKVAILSESEADQGAVHILVNALLGQPIELYERTFRSRGWTWVFRFLPSILKELHYATDVDALAVVMDSDLTPPHLLEHDQLGAADPDCRLCQLREVVRHTQSQLSPTGRTPVQVGIGLAIPCLEAWLSQGRNRAVSEAVWLVALRDRSFPYDCSRLKLNLYGTNKPPIALEARRMREEATRLAGDIGQLATWFPNGFGPFAAEVASWRAA